MTEQTQKYYTDLSYIQNSNHPLCMNTDIMTITGMMDFDAKCKHIVRYADYILENSNDKKTMEIKGKYYK